jgi:broad specificity phosphatase PhoE
MQKTLFFFAFLISGSLWAMPAQIFLIRHAEKPHGEEGTELSEKGWKRAAALPEIFERPEFSRFGRPFALYAMKPGDKQGSVRPRQTLKLVAQKFGLEIQSDYSKKEIRSLVQEIRDDRELDGKMIVICWGHELLEELAEELGASAPNWKDKIYDRVWLFDFDGTKLINFQDLPQRLLPSDSPF